MVNAWGGFANGEIPLSAMKELQGQYFEPSMFQVMVNLINQAAAQGVDIHINEGYRPLGIPSDQFVTSESDTSTGGSNQWFQIGRMHRGETPSAGTPGTSSHGWGMAADINPGRNNSVVRSIAESLGLSFTVPSESWHVALGGGGSSAAQGSEIQKLLNNFGYGLDVDGIVGPKTLAAIKDFQSKHGLEVDGIVGPKTMGALQAGNNSGGDVAGSAEIQQLLNAFGYGLEVDGIVGPKTLAAIKDFQSKHGLEVDGVVGPKTTAALRQGVPKPAPINAPTPVVPAKPVVPVKPTEPPLPIVPVKPTEPVKDPVMPEIQPLPQDANTAANDALGILIPKAKNRKIAYALYGLAALIVSNISVAVMASGTQAPIWLIVTSAVVGNLAVPFTTLAIANAKK
jgi:peptidoglycan hydrolase-like protein with peptidoglycan-binding domain